jgi:dephospho-CoA kinase
MKRDGLSSSDAQARMQAQAPMAHKLRLATRVLDNSESLEHLFEQVNELIPRLRPSKLRYWFWRFGLPCVIVLLVGPVVYGVGVLLSSLVHRWLE